jgi:hypothetical protein
MASSVLQYVTSNTHQAVPAPGQSQSLLSSAGAALTFATTSVAGTVSASVEVGGAVVKLYRTLSDGAVSAGAITMQGSNDNVNFFDTGTAITPGNGAGTIGSLATDTQAWKWIRARVSTTLVGAGNVTVSVHI